MKAGTVFVMLILGVVIGLAVGLFVGWVIWPVEWINASPANMRLLWQTDWINMSIDSYTVNQNAELAVQRYEALGESGPAALAAVMANPQWVTAEDAQAYRDIISEGTTQAGPSLSTEDILDSLSSRLLRPPLLGYFAVALFLSFLAIILLIVLIMRLISSKSKATVTEEIPTQEVMVAESEPTEIAGEPALAEMESEAELEAEISEEGMPEREAPIPIEVIEETEGQIPDEKRDVDLGLAGLAGVAAAAGIAIAGEAEVTEPEAEVQVEKVEEPEEEVETAEPLESIAVAGAGAGAGAELLWALEEEVEEPVGREEMLEEVVEDAAESETWIPESEDQKIPEDFYGKYNRKIIEVEGIGEVYAERLAGVGITTTHAFLQSVSTRKGREELAEKTGISSKLILEWANHVDMMRIQGIGPQWSDLLEAVGVDTVRELAMRNPQNLREAMITVNEEKKLVRQLPTLEMIEDWIEQAKDLPRILTY